MTTSNCKIYSLSNSYRVCITYYEEMQSNFERESLQLQFQLIFLYTSAPTTFTFFQICIKYFHFLHISASAMERFTFIFFHIVAASHALLKFQLCSEVANNNTFCVSLCEERSILLIAREICVS